MRFRQSETPNDVGPDAGTDVATDREPMQTEVMDPALIKRRMLMLPVNNAAGSGHPEAMSTTARVLVGEGVSVQVLDASMAQLADVRRDLLDLGVRGRARAIARVAAYWRSLCVQPNGAWADALEQGADNAELSLDMLRWGIEQSLSRWTEEGLLALVEHELGDVEVLDAAGNPAAVNGSTLAIPPRLCLQILSRTVPPAGWQAMAMAWLLGSPVLVRPSADLLGLTRVFILSLAKVAPALAAATWMAGSDAGDSEYHRMLASHADAVVVHGGDDAVQAWRKHAAPGAIFVDHGHRISAAYLAAEGLDKLSLLSHLRGLAFDICAWDQNGCLSPVVAYVEQGARIVSIDEVAKMLAEVALPEAEKTLPIGAWSREAQAARTLFIRTRMLEARCYTSKTACVLAYPEPGPLEASCLHRVIILRPVKGPDELVRALRVVGPQLQGLAVAGAATTRASLAARLAPYGLSRVCAPGDLQKPPLDWSHDGRGNLRPLVRWVDLE